MNTRWRWRLMVAVGLLVTRPLLAQTQGDRVTRARTECLTGQVESGAALLAELFAETGNANFVYNQGRCYEQNGRFDEAVNRFREYLRVAKGLDQRERTEVEQHIAECKQLAAEGRRPAAEIPPVAGPTSASPSGAELAQARERDPVAARLRWGGLVAGGVGVAAIATGVVFTLLLRHTEQQVESDARAGTYDPGRDRNGRTYETLQWTGYGVGAGLLAGGAVLFWLGERRGSAQRAAVALVPAIAPGRRGLALQGRF